MIRYKYGNFEAMSDEFRVVGISTGGTYEQTAIMNLCKLIV